MTDFIEATTTGGGFWSRLADVLGPDNMLALQQSTLLHTALQSLDLGEGRSAVDHPRQQHEATMLKTLAFQLIKAMLLVGAVDSMVPSNADCLDDIHAIRVALPKLCHAIFLAGQLFQHNKESPFMYPSPTSPSRMWAQVKYKVVVGKEGDGGLYELECSMANPCNFRFGNDFWLQRRYYEPPNTVKPYTLQYLAFLQGIAPQILGESEMVPDYYHDIEYSAAFPKMTLHSVCFYLCLEKCHAEGMLFQVAERHRDTQMPIRVVIRDVADARTIPWLLDRCIPPFFWEKDSQYTWNSRLCLQCRRCSSSSSSHDVDDVLLEPWLRNDGGCQLQSGDVFVDYRYTKPEPPSYPSIYHASCPATLSDEIQTLLPPPSYDDLFNNNDT